MSITILLVEDELSLSNFIAKELEFENYQVILAKDGQEALQLFKQNQTAITIILLDWMLPVYDGITVARRIRQLSDVPIIMMTAKNQLYDKITGLDSGVDDYITKPFEIEELLARIRVAIRREARLTQKSERAPFYQYQDLKLDIAKHLVERFDKEIALTQKEFQLLLALLKRPEKVLTRDQLLNEVWGSDYFGQTNNVDVYIRSLRNKMDYQPEHYLIQTVRGVGYTLRADDDN
ncbi:MULTISPECIES: response regulator transcription factor [unclassified Enterococcus]|uniref:response regulator transcription factor n=1 Tax=unclassified Enterococcus TaxID=2608891 RepID=UPI001554DD59|nr:response regulator transcription factor [Enterococcus sp. MMGLQ5-2]MBS7584789.1 response regulator transcription factor [Enterococcus sp. MMGLQ5-1]NPD12644.1 response regulator transcription factor [Enterococcus sp. MMGLQ5-1]NPD37216.1 response regulator transcription factor [Enterococcus sp. MMGLQ5-2]